MIFIQDFLYTINFEQILFFWKIISYVVSAILFGGIVLLIMKLNVLGTTIREASSALAVSALPKRKLTKRWERIEKTFGLGDEANMKLAIIDADKLFDFVLESLGYRGKSMGEKLEKVHVVQFPWLQDIWDAHKIRNSIVHNPEYQLTQNEAERAIKTFERVLKDLGVLEGED